ncbi:hypothetical protein GCM10019059_35380 [Camelimonas fluminis]|uniref:Alpha/beta hydrolase n=1 Tax=Camelimonas fluminis TaxID=1576911 RepID=A0ABV7UH95_9HYPH|nr:alpha/beta fold hydrolase [Camelimonas fluminis]GHE72665.1 hypothetical protein GCM10019059_35380 [Camelimonas fluminis]
MTDFSLRYAGDRTGFLLIHGLGGTPVELRPVARALNRAGHTVHCPQLAGHCGDEADLLATTWRDWETSVLAALADLRGSCATVIVGGLSMGAILAMRVAAERPDLVDGLALFAPTLRYDGWAIPRYAFLLRWLINTPLGRRFSFVEREPYGVKNPRTRAMIKRAMTSGASEEAGLASTPSGAIRELWRLVDETWRAMPEIRCPALVVHAREDDISGLSNAFDIQRRLGGLVDAVILDNSYHLVTLDQQQSVLVDRTLALGRRVANDDGRRRSASRLRLAVADSADDRGYRLAGAAE